jgi:hypothetical protein
VACAIGTGERNPVGLIRLLEDDADDDVDDAMIEFDDDLVVDGVSALNTRGEAGVDAEFDNKFGNGTGDLNCCCILGWEGVGDSSCGVTNSVLPGRL